MKLKKYITKAFFVIIICVMSLQSQAFAEVYTTQQTSGKAYCIYIAGNPDNFPIEYYDDDTGKYSGMIPDILKKVSDRTGIDFVYINGNKRDRENLGKNLQVEIVSSTEYNTESPYFKDYIELISYEKDGTIQKAGLTFTQLADDGMVERVKSTVNQISTEEKNGILISYSSQINNDHYKWYIASGVACILLISAILFLVSRIRRIKNENLYDKLTDTETGMGNLQYFKLHFKNTIGDISRNLYYVAYIILDSNYLRTYHGDSSFDDVLKYTASVLKEYTQSTDFSARIDENDFAIALQSTNDEDASKRLLEIMEKLNSFENMIEQNNKLVFHCAVYHLNNTDKNSELLLFNLRKNCNKVLNTEQQILYCDKKSMNKVQEEKNISESILHGFEHNEFKMFLQFIVNNKTKQIVSAEALSRWDSPQKGLIGPGQYIGNMENAGLISRHDFYMFELVCRQLEAWSDTKYNHISLSCNFTRITLSEENFIDRLKMIANGYSFDHSKLAIEITEDAIEKNREVAKRNVMLCKELGFRIHLDDLGSGYTSLANLCDYPIDIVKIDRDILLKAENDRGKELFTGIVALAHSLNIKVICEGVETTEQNDLVSKSDCDLIQGWYYSKALPLEECESFMERYENK